MSASLDTRLRPTVAACIGAHEFLILGPLQHNMFPLIYPEGHPKDKALFGTIMRESLVVLLQSCAFSSSSTVSHPTHDAGGLEGEVSHSRQSVKDP